MIRYRADRGGGYEVCCSIRMVMQNMIGFKYQSTTSLK
jgi:hypothetical protein